MKRDLKIKLKIIFMYIVYAIIIFTLDNPFNNINFIVKFLGKKIIKITIEEIIEIIIEMIVKKTVKVIILILQLLVNDIKFRIDLNLIIIIMIYIVFKCFKEYMRSNRKN